MVLGSIFYYFLTCHFLLVLLGSYPKKNSTPYIIFFLQILKSKELFCTSPLQSTYLWHFFSYQILNKKYTFVCFIYHFTALFYHSISVGGKKKIFSFFRVLLYQAVEDLLFKFGLEGKACLLRAICEMHESPLIGYGFFGEVLELFLTYVFVYIKYPYLYWVWSIFSQIFFSNGILVIFWRYSTFFALPILNWVFWHVLSTVLLLHIWQTNGSQMFVTL